MDLMSDALFDSRQIHRLTIVDHFTRESLAIEARRRMLGKDVVNALEHVACDRQLPKSIRVDNGPEFTSKVLDQWVYANGVTHDFSWPEKPTDNAFVESFNQTVARFLRTKIVPMLNNPINAKEEGSGTAVMLI